MGCIKDLGQPWNDAYVSGHVLNVSIYRIEKLSSIYIQKANTSMNTVKTLFSSLSVCIWTRGYFVTSSCFLFCFVDEYMNK